MRTGPKYLDRLSRLQQYKVDPETGCHLWTGKSVQKGYGCFSYNGKHERAHRLAYEEYKGPVPEGMVVRHMCHNKLCINPDHLEVGTLKDNTQDMLKAGRNTIEPREYWREKISEYDARLMAALWRRGYTPTRIQKMFRINNRGWYVVKEFFDKGVLCHG